ncbi:MAG: tRNA (cytidine(34)-2'-O)-methyltransferase [Rhodospirillaceae bacterium]|nr:tRNA (cytidine(34)-2'-O)-methyltransferase [Rhodospirillaceae bacterium]
MRLALYQPDIPQNMGAVMRIAACFRVPLDVIEPCGFPFDEKRLRRTAMDYGDLCDITRHASWAAYLAGLRQTPNRLVLLTTATNQNHTEFAFAPTDTLLLGRESHGVPPEVHAAADACVRIPIARGLRSLNVSVAGAIVLAEALRQLGEFNGKTEL